MRRSPTKPIPRYMMPNFSSLLPAYANAEADHIRSAFARTHHASIQKLPARLAPQAVNRARLEQMDMNRLSLPGEGLQTSSDLSTSSVYSSKSPRTKTRTAGAAITTNKSGYFQPLEYTPSPFSLPDELAQLERLKSHAHRSAISGAPFVSSNNPTKLKYEDSFGDSGFRYPHLAEPSPPQAKDVGVKKNFLRESSGGRARSVLAGEPRGFGGFGGGGVVTRKLLPDMIRELHDVLRGDWPELDFDVVPDETAEAIVVCVREASVESEPALAAYMNVLVRSNHVVASKYRLQKVAEDWNIKPGDGALYFAMRPPWAKNRSKDLVVVLANGNGV